MRIRSRAAVKLVVCFVLVLVFLGLYKSTTVATVDYALQTGQPCGACHVRPEGGGELSAQGVAFAQGGYQWPIPEGIKPYTPSNAMRALRMVVGYIHVTVAILWFGTIFYINFAIRARRLTTGAPKTESTIGWLGMGIMAVTGSVLTVYRYLETGSVFAGTFGTVFILKLAQFGAMVILAFVATVVVTRRIKRNMHPLVLPTSSSGEITPETLSSFDGQEGARAVIAVSGKLYEVTDSQMWPDGVHLRQHRAGQDLTETLEQAPHGGEVLEKVKMIGELASPPAMAGVLARAGINRSRAQRFFVSLTHVNFALTFGILLCVVWWKWGFSWRGSSPSPNTTAVAPLSEATAVAPLSKATAAAPLSEATSVAILSDATAVATPSEASAGCIACHTQVGFMRAQIVEWERSTHAKNQVGCYECHSAEPGDPDAMNHYSYTISVLVTPKDCGECHVREAEQFAASRHSRGGDILDSLDNVLGERVEGVAAAVLGCQQCHGAPVEVLDDGTLSAASWPNTGIGRINPDGSLGACSTCHTRHLFSVAVAREPDACGNCHMGPDHPQKEIYEESKHGIAFKANREVMNLGARPWVLGQDYAAAPTCATCHMSAVPGLEVNHDVGLRIAWTLRPVVSTRLENWQARRKDMTMVCRQCHSPGFYNSFFQQFDDAVELYNEKFAVPALEIMQLLREAGVLTDLDFDEPIEWTYFYLWHHEGRRARHGAAMMGPDYVQWHGFYEVADRFYNEFVPEAEALLPGVTESFLQAEHHQWRATQ